MAFSPFHLFNCTWAEFPSILKVFALEIQFSSTSKLFCLGVKAGVAGAIDIISSISYKNPLKRREACIGRKHKYLCYVL